MREIWKPIKEYNGIYHISNLGRIKSFYTNRMSGQKPGYIKKTRIMLAGYLSVSLRLEDSSKTHFVHRLIAQTFIDNPENKPQVNHIDGNKLNNSIHNLEWCTAQENVKHYLRLGLKKTFGPPKGTPPWCKGKNISDEHKKNISLAKKGIPSKKIKKVIDISTGKIYNRIEEAAVAVNMSYACLYSRLSNKMNNNTNLIFYENINNEG